MFADATLQTELPKIYIHEEPTQRPKAITVMSN